MAMPIGQQAQWKHSLHQRVNMCGAFPHDDYGETLFGSGGDGGVGVLCPIEIRKLAVNAVVW